MKDKRSLNCKTYYLYKIEQSCLEHKKESAKNYVFKLLEKVVMCFFIFVSLFWLQLKIM